MKLPLYTMATAFVSFIALISIPAISHAATVYFWSNGSDPSWTNSANWFSDIGTTTSLNDLPQGDIDGAVILGNIAPQVDLDSWGQPLSIDASSTGIVFTSSGGNGLNVTVTGSTTFNGLGINESSITGTTTFNGFSYNDGKITGSTTFNDGSTNNDNGTIIGTTTFNDASSNVGTINGTAIFTNAIGGTITIPTDGIWGCGTASSVVGGDLNPITEWIFNGGRNIGTTASTTFNNGTYNDNDGVITGTTVINDGGYNNGTITGTTTFYGNSYNFGTIIGNAKFMSAHAGVYTASDGGDWGGGHATSNIGDDDQVIREWVFKGVSFNSGNTASTTFNDTSRNYGMTATTTYNGNSSNFGTSATSTLNNFAYSDGDIIGPAIFRDFSANDNSVATGRVIGQAQFYGNAQNDGEVDDDANFYDSSANYGSVKNNSIFSNFAYNQGTITGIATFANGVGGILIISDGHYWGHGSAGLLIGGDLTPLTDWVFNGSSENDGTISGSTTFNGSSVNVNGVIGTSTFNDSSSNQGGVVGFATFNDSSSNMSSVTGDAVFNADFSVNNNVVSGTKTRRYTLNVSTLRDFVTDGPWTIIADGAEVNVSGAKIDGDPNSAASTTFASLHGGCFIGGPFPVCSNPPPDSDPTPPPPPPPPPPSPPPSQPKVSYSSSSGGRASPSILAALGLLPLASAPVPRVPSCPAGYVCRAKPVTTHPNPLAATNSPAPNITSKTFTRNIQIGNSGSDVKVLQQYLNANGFTIATSGLGSPGNETSIFGSLTKKALTRFQKSHGIPSTGYFGPLTRDLISTLSTKGCEISNSDC